MPKSSKKSFLSALPLLTISIPKLSIAVIIAALLTMSLFVIENKNQIAATPLATAVLSKPITITFKITSMPETTINCFEHETLADAIKNNFPSLTPASTWLYKINDAELTTSPDRFALKSGDIIEINSSPTE